MLTPFELGVVAHLIEDFPLQNTWMVVNKVSLKHPAAWVHGGIHALFLGLALGWQAGLVLGFLHMLVDCRVVLLWWQKHIQQSVEGPTVLHTRIWTDQVVHIAMIAGWVHFA